MKYRQQAQLFTMPARDHRQKRQRAERVGGTGAIRLTVVAAGTTTSGVAEAVWPAAKELPVAGWNCAVRLCTPIDSPATGSVAIPCPSIGAVPRTIRRRQTPPCPPWDRPLEPETRAVNVTKLDVLAEEGRSG